MLRRSPARRFTRRRFFSAALVVSGLIAGESVAAQQPCLSAAPSTARWPAPLDRVISVSARNVALREGLDRVAAAARVRVSYSPELLPLDQRVCLVSDSITAGDALAALLVGSSVEPAIAGADQVVITAARSGPPDAMTSSIQTLDRVVVTGSALGDSQRPLSVALDVVDGKAMATRSTSTFSSTFDGSVPGVWVWDQSPGSLLARYGSIRGASSFGVSYPKVYIDGIEVANPLLVTEMNPTVLDRVEVIRGPQGAALYGADAISGVVNIITRHEGTQAGADRTEATTGAGFSQSAFGARSVFAQDHALSWRGGSSMKSGSLAMNVSTLGDYVPDAYSRDVKLNAAGRIVGTHASVSGTARFFGKQAANGENPLLRGFTQSAVNARSVPTGPRSSLSEGSDDIAMPLVQDTLPESVREYTVGGTTTFFTSGAWTPSIVAGIDGYRLTNVPNELAPISSSADTALHAARGGADRGTIRASMVGNFALAPRETLTLTFAGEHSSLRELDVGGALLDADGDPLPGGQIAPDRVVWKSNTGLSAQANAGFNDAVYLTGGLRLERNDGYSANAQTAALPMLGVAGVRDIGGATLKLRGAYGRGIRPVDTPTRGVALHDIRRRPGAPMLEPEEQTGTEVGADLLFGRRVALHATRFDQIASGLIQAVSLPRDSVYRTSGGEEHYHDVAYVLQNVGEISNRGWELESSLRIGALSLGGALSLVDSRVRKLARGYTGDLMPGDRMLAVPGRTASLSATWTRPRWFATFGASRASNWTNYDRLALAAQFADTTTSSESLTGSSLRAFWREYDGVTRLRATLSRDLTSVMSVKLTGENLTNVQRGEPDNITLLPGRTLMLGLSAKIH